MHSSVRRYLPAAAAAGALLGAWLTFYAVRETEFVLLTQFGRPIATVTEPGLHAKWFFQRAHYFDRRLRLYNPRPSEFLTRDKKNLLAECYVVWQIQDPKRFLETVGEPGAAEMRLHDIVWSSLAAAFGTHDLDSIVAPSAETVQVSDLLDKLTASTDAQALERYGVRVIDVRIKRLNLPEQNKQAVYARMRAERERIARQYRAEGEEQALKIRAEADRRREEILSAAYREAEKLKGEGDAESTRIYSQAYARNPQLFKLLRTLESYKKIFADNTTAILSSDSELLKILVEGERAAR